MAHCLLRKDLRIALKTMQVAGALLAGAPVVQRERLLDGVGSRTGAPT